MKKFKNLSLVIVVIIASVLTVLNFVACNDTPVYSGKECTSCSSNSDCLDGMTCKKFYSNGPPYFYSLCAHTYTSSCN
jgi:hypothetical protein